MKKAIVMTLLVVFSTFTVKADKVDKFLKNFDKFVAEVCATEEHALSNENYAKIETKYNAFITEYNETFKDLMTTEQVTQFNRARGRYQKKMLAIKAKRKGAAAKGLIEGLVGAA